MLGNQISMEGSLKTSLNKTTNLLATLATLATVLVFLLPLNSNNTQNKASHNIYPVPLYVFGDSLYDTGMALHVDKGPAADSYPYGETYFKRPAGRFSDGRLIPDFIAQFANLPFPEPYLNPNLSDYTESVNFADASAGVLVETRPNTLNLKLQTEYFVEMVQKLEQQFGETETKKVVARAVYLFNIGANDYVDLYYLNPKPLSPSLKRMFLNQILGNFTSHITTIYNQGGRKFAFQGFAPIGCFPTFLQDDGTCTTELNDLAKMHNVGFEALLKRLARQLPGLKYSIYDFYTSLSARLSDSHSYGFKESKTACCGSGPFNGKFTCMDKENFTVCSSPADHIWFDAGHPSEKADQQFAEEFWNGPFNIVSPRNLKSMFGEH